MSWSGNRNTGPPITSHLPYALGHCVCMLKVCITYIHTSVGFFQFLSMPFCICSSACMPVPVIHKRPILAQNNSSRVTRFDLGWQFSPCNRQFSLFLQQYISNCLKPALMMSPLVVLLFAGCVQDLWSIMDVVYCLFQAIIIVWHEMTV